MAKMKHKVEVTEGYDGVDVRFSDNYHTGEVMNVAHFSSTEDVKEFAYELLSAAMKYELENDFSDDEDNIGHRGTRRHNRIRI
jgi:hypothetical protein